MKKWKVLKSRMALDEKWFKVRCDEVELPSGKILPDYFVWESGNVSMTVPLTNEGKLILVRQYKHGIGQIMIEFPAGYLNKAETPEQCARRELSEETGREVMKLPRAYARGIFSPCFVGSGIPPKQKVLRIHPQTYV